MEHRKRSLIFHENSERTLNRDRNIFPQIYFAKSETHTRSLFGDSEHIYTNIIKLEFCFLLLHLDHSCLIITNSWLWQVRTDHLFQHFLWCVYRHNTLRDSLSSKTNREGVLATCHHNQSTLFSGGGGVVTVTLPIPQIGLARIKKKYY